MEGTGQRYMKKFQQICHNLDDTKKLAYKFASLIKDGCFINLYGEIGAGKTAFVKLVADALDVKEKVADSFESATSGGDGGIRTHVPD